MGKKFRQVPVNSVLHRVKIQHFCGFWQLARGLQMFVGQFLSNGEVTMAIQTVNNQPPLGVVQNSTTTPGATQLGDSAALAFVQALGKVVAFQGAGTLPSLPGILDQAAIAQQNSAPPPVQVQQNTVPQQQDNSEQQVVQSAPSAPVQQPVRQSSANNQPVKTVSSDDSSDTTQSTASTETGQSANTDPTSDPTVMAVVAQQFVQVVQAAVQVNTGNSDTGSTTQQQATDTQQNTADAHKSTLSTPVGNTGLVLNQGQQIAGQTTDTGNQDANSQSQNQSGDQTDFAALLQGNTASTQKSAWLQANQASAQLSVKDQQANDLAASLNGTGANLSIKVDVVDQSTQSQTATTTDEASDAAATALQVLAAATQLNTGLNGQGLNNGNNQTTDNSNATASAVGDLKTTMPDASVQNAQAFNAVLAAQMETAQTETPVVQETPAISGVNAAAAAQGAQNNTQSTQSAQAPQAPQAPTPPRTLQQAQVMDQVSLQISKQAKDGVDNITVKLNPQELGRVEIKLDVAKDGSVTATITAENKDTLAMLQKDSGSLAKALSDAGLSTDAGSMNFNLRGEGQQQQFAGNSNSQQNGGRARWAALNSGADDDSATAAAATSSSLSAVDLSV